ncbi:hypothetical protein ElyMa_001328000 [Elysia marginata]|uniref:C-type lectin domain-containing protein n=1 Tax=Elysia marginata TaxID=1093978 RepID=A0AAV4ILS2_9GAST|nr:hypothetical protein ElyMa_001328000 [Elysia marginata]
MSSSSLTVSPCFPGCVTDAGSPCDVYLPGADYHSNACFRPVSHLMTSEDAEAYCEKLDAKVVEPSTDSLISYMARFTSWHFGWYTFLVLSYKVR